MNTFEIMTYVMSAVAIVVLGVIFVFALKRYLKLRNRADGIGTIVNNSNLEIEETTDEYDIVTTYAIDKTTGKLVSLTKSNGEFYNFENDEVGRLVYYKNHLGVEYRCKYNDDNQVIYYENCITGKKYDIEYDDNGRVCYMKDINTGLEEWYTYNEDNKIYLIKNSEGQCTYNICRMPKNVEININKNLEGYQMGV